MHILCTAMFGHVGFDSPSAALHSCREVGRVGGGGSPEVLILGLRENGCKWGFAPFRLSRLPEDAGAASDAWQARRFTTVGPGLQILWAGALQTDPFPRALL